MQLFYSLGLPSENIGIHGHHDTTKNQSQSYIPITGCILFHILSSLTLSSLEKIYYLLADSLSCINSSKGRNRSISLPAKSWATRLSCSKSEVFALQKSLENKGYFLIFREKNLKGQNNRNTITTTIPDYVFNDLKFEPDRFNLNSYSDTKTQSSDHSLSDNLNSIDKTFIPTLEGKRQYLAKTKMFIRLPYRFLKKLSSNCNISATSKIVLLHFFSKIYKSSANKYKYDPDCSGSRYNYNNSVDDLTHNPSSIVISYQEVQTELKLHRNTIARSLKDLEDNNYISKQRFTIKDTEEYNSRADKSLWQISLLNIPLITNSNNQHEQTDYEELTNTREAEQTDQQYYLPKTLINNQNQEEHIGQQEALISDQTKLEYNNNIDLESSRKWACTKYDPACTDSGQLYIKDFVLNNSISNNLDYIDEDHLNFNNLPLHKSISSFKTLSKTKNTIENIEINHKEEFLENELCSFPSKSYKNSFKDYVGTKSSCSNTNSEPAIRTIKDIAVKTRELAKSAWQKQIASDIPRTKKVELQKDKKEEWRELRHFYPLSDKDTNLLNSRANREFSNNFVNQLLLKLYIKYPEKRFKNKFTFISYMEKTLKNEKHQGPLVNHRTFRFSCNINAEEKNIQEYEKYLNQIEGSIDTSKEMQVKKKIAGRFSTEVAYKILKQVEFKTNHDNSFITVLIPNDLGLSERQIAILREQLEAVYGCSGHYVSIVEEYVESSKYKGERGKVILRNGIEEEKKGIVDKTTICKNVSNYIANIVLSKSRSIDTDNENPVWNQIRACLREELGEAKYKAWFEKAESKECKETKTLTLIMPTKFMADWVKNNYSHVLRRIAGSAGIDFVEYGYE